MIDAVRLCVRVRPDVDNADFPARFRKDMAEQLRLGNLYLLDVQPLSYIRDGYIRSIGVENEVKTRVAVACFLLANIFLGIIGTFWFRTQQRRSEIALHKALGGTNRTIFNRLLTEGLLLLVIATVPAIVIDWNLAHAELNSWMNGTTLETGRFIITTVLTFVLITLMIVTGIGIPARKAMKIQPAEALREE